MNTLGTHVSGTHTRTHTHTHTHCSRFQDLLDRTAEIARQIDSSRAVFAISLDNTRNRIARMNLDISTGMDGWVGWMEVDACMHV